MIVVSRQHRLNVCCGFLDRNARRNCVLMSYSENFFHESASPKIFLQKGWLSKTESLCSALQAPRNVGQLALFNLVMRLIHNWCRQLNSIMGGGETHASEEEGSGQKESRQEE